MDANRNGRGHVMASVHVGQKIKGKGLPWRVVWRHLPGIIAAQMRMAFDALRAIRGAAARARLRGMLVGLLTWPRVLPARRRVLSTTLVSPTQFEKTIKRFSRQAEDSSSR